MKYFINIINCFHAKEEIKLDKIIKSGVEIQSIYEIFLHPGLFCNLLQWTLLALTHRSMTTYLNYIWDLDTQLGVSTGCRMLYTGAVLLCSVPRPLPYLGREVRQLPTKSIRCTLLQSIILWAWPDVAERRMIKPCTTAAQWKCSILRQVSPLVRCSSNRSTGKQSIAPFSLVLPLLIFSCISSLQKLMKGHTRMSNNVLTNESFWCFSRSWIINTNQRSHLSYFTSHWVQQGLPG